MNLLFTANHFQYSPSEAGGISKPPSISAVTGSLQGGGLDMHFGAHPLIFKKAEELRNRMTAEEELLWNYLRNNAWGYKFRRQHPLFMYVADFYCHQLKLIIEIDGSIHELEDVKRNDAIRENHLKSLGLKVIRFKNEEVLNNLEIVLIKIKELIQHEK